VKICQAVDTFAELIDPPAVNDRRRRGVVNDVGQRHVRERLGYRRGQS
jgi:hypothetical protein